MVTTTCPFQPTLPFFQLSSWGIHTFACASLLLSPTLRMARASPVTVQIHPLPFTAAFMSEKKTGPQAHVLWSHWHDGPFCFSPFVGRLPKLNVCGLSFLFFFFFLSEGAHRQDNIYPLEDCPPPILLTSRATEKRSRTEKHDIKIFHGPMHLFVSGAYHGVEATNNLAFKQDESFSLIYSNIWKRNINENSQSSKKMRERDRDYSIWIVFSNNTLFEPRRSVWMWHKKGNGAKHCPPTIYGGMKIEISSNSHFLLIFRQLDSLPHQTSPFCGFETLFYFYGP